MIEKGQSNANEMILAFLKAEVDSPRFQALIHDGLRQFCVTREGIIYNANLEDDHQNQIREKLLGRSRGYNNDQFLFKNFPSDIHWRRIELEPRELEILKYANHPTWLQLSGGDRLVISAAKNIDTIPIFENNHNINESIKIVADNIKKGVMFPELIAVEDNQGYLILLEGHTRATAYAVANIRSGIEIIVGSSANIQNWGFF